MLSRNSPCISAYFRAFQLRDRNVPLVELVFQIFCRHSHRHLPYTETQTPFCQRKSEATARSDILTCPNEVSLWCECPYWFPIDKQFYNLEILLFRALSSWLFSQRMYIAWECPCQLGQEEDAKEIIGVGFCYTRRLVIFRKMGLESCHLPPCASWIFDFLNPHWG